MNKDYKAKLLEKAGIYVDCCQLLATRKKALEESKKNLNLKDTAEIEGVEPGTDTEEIKVSETKKFNKVQEAENV